MTAMMTSQAQLVCQIVCPEQQLLVMMALDADVQADDRYVD
jgi:hypothetical protein